MWENLDLGRVYRPHCVRSVLTTSVKILPYRPPARLIRAKHISPRKSWARDGVFSATGNEAIWRLRVRWRLPVFARGKTLLMVLSSLFQLYMTGLRTEWLTTSFIIRPTTFLMQSWFSFWLGKFVNVSFACVTYPPSVNFARKIYPMPNAWLLKSECKRIQIAWKAKTFTIPTSNETAIPCSMKFSRSLISRILDFSSFAGMNFREFGFQTLLLGIIFRGFHVRYLKVTKKEAIWSFSLHRFQPIPLKFSNLNKGSRCLQIFLGGSLFSRDLIFADRWKIREVCEN